MKSTLNTLVLLSFILFSQTGFAADGQYKGYGSMQSLGGCQACIDSYHCDKANKTCRRTCDVSLLMYKDKIADCKLDCTKNWSSCNNSAKSSCRDYCAD